MTCRLIALVPTERLKRGNVCASTDAEQAGTQNGENCGFWHRGTPWVYPGESNLQHRWSPVLATVGQEGVPSRC